MRSRYPLLVDEIINDTHMRSSTVEIRPGRWAVAKPLGQPYGNLLTRIRCAWLVLVNKAGTYAYADDVVKSSHR